MMSLIANEYLHCNKEMALNLASAESGETTSFFRSMACKAANGVLNATLIDDLWKGLQDRVGAHAMENYRLLVTRLMG
jgi:hypothetical protein